MTLPTRPHLRPCRLAVAAFAAALGLAYAASAGGGEPTASEPAGSRAVPLELSAPAGEDLSLGAAERLPALARPRAPSADPTPQPVSAPVPAPPPPEPEPVDPYAPPDAPAAP
ncbi:MAG: hypothetical protein ACRDM7_01145, partial [Thermoleophilaceae bacterium]